MFIDMVVDSGFKLVTAKLQRRGFLIGQSAPTRQQSLSLDLQFLSS